MQFYTINFSIKIICELVKFASCWIKSKEIYPAVFEKKFAEYSISYIFFVQLKKIANKFFKSKNWSKVWKILQCFIEPCIQNFQDFLKNFNLQETLDSLISRFPRKFYFTSSEIFPLYHLILEYLPEIIRDCTTK